MKILEGSIKKVSQYVIVALMLLFVLVGCTNQKSESTENYLPPLNDDYAYLRVEVLSKNIEKKTMNVKVADFGFYSTVNIGDIPIGKEGIMDCSNLLTIRGIKEGAEWIASYKKTNQTDFPIIVYSIESVVDFDERVKEGSK